MKIEFETLETIFLFLNPILAITAIIAVDALGYSVSTCILFAVVAVTTNMIIYKYIAKQDFIK